jgi:catechol 2,3-dioxygenase-like lactoylglutathione lyase family enzyme
MGQLAVQRVARVGARHRRTRTNCCGVHNITDRRTAHGQERHGVEVHLNIKASPSCKCEVPTRVRGFARSVYAVPPVVWLSCGRVARAEIHRNSWRRRPRDRTYRCDVTTDSVTCSCCGETRKRAETGSLACHPDTVVCRGCVHWLAVATGVVWSTPILATADMTASRRFYETAGFVVDAYDDGYAFVSRNGGEVLHLALSDVVDPKRNDAALYINTLAAEQWHAVWCEAGLPVGALTDRPWGMREFEVADPSGNVLRIGRNVPSPDEAGDSTAA